MTLNPSQEDAEPLVEADELPPQRHTEIVGLQTNTPQQTLEDFTEIIQSHHEPAAVALHHSLIRCHDRMDPLRRIRRSL